MKKTLDELTALSYEALDDRLRVLKEQVDSRITRCQAEDRDMQYREVQLTEDAKLEISAIRDAIMSKDAEARQREQTSDRMQLIGRAIEQRQAASVWRPTLLVSETNLRAHLKAINEGGVFGATEPIETRTQVTAPSDMGSAAAWAAGGPQEPRNLIRFSGVPVSQLTGRTASAPRYTGPAGVAGADEGSDHTEFDGVTKVDVTALRYGAWTDVSSIVGELDDLRGINVMHSWQIARSLDKLAVDVIETAAGPPVGVGDLEEDVRTAVLTVGANTYSDEGSLVIVGTPADLASLVGTTPTSGADVESFAVRFNGARLYGSNEASPGQLSVFAPNAFRCFQSPLQSASVIDPKSGAQTFGSWLHSTELANQIVGSAVAVATGLGSGSGS